MFRPTARGYISQHNATTYQILCLQNLGHYSCFTLDDETIQSNSCAHWYLGARQSYKEHTPLISLLSHSYYMLAGSKTKNVKNPG